MGKKISAIPPITIQLHQHKPHSFNRAIPVAAVDQKIEEQTEFVRWWKETVGVNHGAGRGHKNNADPRSFSKDDAESITGITQQQVSKWAKKLQKPDQYRAQLFGAAYIISANVHRRHLNKGQRAMVTAMAYPEAAKLRRKGSSVISSGKDKKDDPSEAHISKARFVLRNNFTPEGQQYPDQCLAVMAERIQARAIRRCGELLKQVETGQGVRTDLLHDAADMKLTRTEAATQAGLSERQKVTALRVANTECSRACPPSMLYARLIRTSASTSTCPPSTFPLLPVQ